MTDGPKSSGHVEEEHAGSVAFGSETGKVDTSSMRYVELSRVRYPLSFRQSYRTRLTNIHRPDTLRSLGTLPATTPIDASDAVVITQTLEDLFDLVKAWMAKHPDRDPPGSLPSTLPSSQMAQWLEHPRKLVFVGTTEEVRVLKQAISKNIMVFILTDGAEWYMLVKPHPDNNRYWLSFSAWLGEDDGFTKNGVASTDGLSWPDVSLEASDDDMDDGDLAVLGTHARVADRAPAGTSRALVPIAKTRRGLLETSESDSELTELHYTSDTSTASSEDIEEDLAPKPNPPLSSLETIKRARQPTQTSLSKPRYSLRQRDNPAAPLSKIEVTDSIIRKLRKSPTNVTHPKQGRSKRRISAIDESPVPETKKHARTNTMGNRPREAKTPPRRQQPKMPLTPPSTGLKAKRVKSTEASVTLDFSLVDTTLGIVSKSWDICSTIETFSAVAASAAASLSKADSPFHVGVLVADVQGGDARLYFAHENVYGYNKLRASIAKAAKGKEGEVHVKVFCLKKDDPDLSKLPAFKS